MIQIIEKNNDSAMVTDGKNTVEIVYAVAGQIWVAVNGAQFPKIAYSIQEAVGYYKRQAIKDLIKTAASAVA